MIINFLFSRIIFFCHEHTYTSGGSLVVVVVVATVTAVLMVVAVMKPLVSREDKNTRRTHPNAHNHIPCYSTCLQGMAFQGHGRRQTFCVSRNVKIRPEYTRTHTLTFLAIVRLNRHGVLRAWKAAAGPKTRRPPAPYACVCPSRGLSLASTGRRASEAGSV